MSDDTAWPELARLAIVSNEAEAALVRGLLTTASIDSMSRVTDVAFGQGGELPSAGGGPREVLVRAEQLEDARALLVEATRAAP